MFWVTPDNLSLTQGHEGKLFPIDPFVLHPTLPCERHLTWESRAVPEARSWCDLHWGPTPRTETRGRIRNRTRRRFSKAAAAAAQREEGIASSAILSEERGTESKGLWDAGGPNSATLISSPFPLIFSGPGPGNSFSVRRVRRLGSTAFSFQGLSFEYFTQPVIQNNAVFLFS